MTLINVYKLAPCCPLMLHMAQSFYTAVTWQPTSKTTSRYGTKLTEKIEAKAVSNEQVESLTNALKQAFSEIKLLKSRLDASEWESKMFAQSCVKYMDEAENIKQKHKMDLMSHHQESETKHKTLEERCKSLSAWAEQHRISSEKHLRTTKQHEETIKAQSTSLQQHKEAMDMQEKMIAAHANIIEASNVQINAKEARINKLEDTIKAKDITIQSHKDHINKHKENIKSMEESQKKAEFSKQLKDKACSVLKTSSEILGLAADKTSETSPEQLSMWLAEVCCAINGLERDIRESQDIK